MATGMHMDARSVDCLVLGHHDQDRKVSAKSVTMPAMTLCKNLSGYRELLLRCNIKIIKICIKTRYEIFKYLHMIHITCMYISHSCNT